MYSIVDICKGLGHITSGICVAYMDNISYIFQNNLVL